MAKNILVLTSSFPRYEGDYFGPWILDYCRETVRQGHNVFVLAPVVGNNQSKILTKDNLVINRFTYWWPSRHQKLVHPPGMIPQLKSNILRIIQIPFLIWAFYRTAVKLCRKVKVDIIHCQWIIPSGFIGALLKIRFNIPLIITSQGAEFFLSESHPFSFFTRWTIKHADRLLPVSLQMAKRSKKYGASRDKVTVVPNAVDTNKFKPGLIGSFRKNYAIPENATIILTIRRLVKEKRVEDIIEAYAKLENKGNVYLVIVGDGPELSILQSRVDRLKDSSRVIFIGYINNKDLPTIYSESDIYVLSSQQEGLSLSMLEAMSSGLVVISTGSTGGNELIESGLNGYLYPIGDIVLLTSLIQNILNLELPNMLDIGELARETIKSKYSIRSMVESWDMIYEKCQR